MEAAEKIYEALERYQGELRAKIKELESRLSELTNAVPLAKQAADIELRKLSEALVKEKATLESSIIPLREQKASLDNQIDKARAAFEDFLAQKGNRIEEEIGKKNAELNGIVTQLNTAQARLIQITSAIVKAKEDIARL